MLHVKTNFKKPAWLKKQLPSGNAFESVRCLIENGRLHTVCQEAKCPNIWECFSNQTATFLILGPICTRNCRFCAVTHGNPEAPDPEEPARIAQAAAALQLSHVVVTSVTRDDLPDGGASVFSQTIQAIRQVLQKPTIEVLIPDFLGNIQSLHTVMDACPHVVNHNIETVPRLYDRVRKGADYQRSLTLLKRAKQYNSSLPTKSGIMLGLGEHPDEIRASLEDLLSVGCDMLTIGQYLQPSKMHVPVDRYVSPEEFENWKQTALQMGFKRVASGPFVRSSYHAKSLYRNYQS